MRAQHQPIENPDFVGRSFEKQRVLEAAMANEASILIVYGRRRIGKTELIEQTLRNRHLIKLEGVEGGDKQAQMVRVLYQLSKALDDPYLAKMQFSTWLELLDFIADKLSEGEWTLYFEELQWLAEYKDEFIADLKYVWDNKLRHNAKLLLVLCGSSPSFMKNHVVHSKALYNRSIYELNLREFTLAEASEFLGNERSKNEIMNAYLSVGGIPEYLKRIKKSSSIQIGLCENSFKKESYFSTEHNKIFISSFAESTHYKTIIDYLSLVKFATRPEIENFLKIHGGGNLSEILNDLEACGFVEHYVPFQALEGSKLSRYCISDNYLRYYFKFIHPILKKIEQGDYNQSPMRALNKESYQKWLGFAFERFCRVNHRLIASFIGFKAVDYKSGAFFNRATDKVSKGYQIDLIFDRADHVLTVCEVKYLQSKVGVEVINEFEEKLKLLPNAKSKTIEKVLIAANGASDTLIARDYFDYIITLDDIFGVSI
jgi:AAA+ ATPase superfamily predicted ATPase